MFFVCLHGNYQSKYDFVETPRKFIISKLSIRKLGSSSVLVIMSTIMAHVVFPQNYTLKLYFDFK